MDERTVLSPVDRLLLLRAEPIFRDLPPAELAMVADSVHERRFAPGELLLCEGERAGAAYVIAEGMVRLRSHGAETGMLGPKSAVGLAGMLARSGEMFDVIAEGSVVALELDSDALSDLLEDHFPILVHLVGRLSRSLRDRGWEALAARSSPAPVARTDRPLDLLERIRLLSRFPFVRVSFSALAELAENITELRTQQAETLWSEGEPARWMVLIVSGGVTCTSAQQQFRADQDRILGALDALSAAPRSCTAIADAGSVLLRIDVELLFDLCEDHPDVLLEMLAVLARRGRESTEHGTGW